MQIAIIAAMAHDRVIGHNNEMPWHLPADLIHFKRTTLGKPIIMGRKTFESIGKPLPGRANIVLTSDKNLSIEGCQVATSTQDALRFAQQALQESEHNEVMIIGGANVYEQFLPVAKRLYLTWIDAQCEGDTFFPDWDDGNWRMVSCEKHGHDENNPHDYTFVVMERDDEEQATNA